MSAPVAPESLLEERHRRHWRQNLRLTGALLAVWFVVGFGATYFARDLEFRFFGWPFSFWLAAQGGPLVYALLTWYYARRMRQLDRAHGVQDSAD